MRQANCTELGARGPSHPTPIIEIRRNVLLIRSAFFDLPCAPAPGGGRQNAEPKIVRRCLLSPHVYVLVPLSGRRIVCTAEEGSGSI